MEAKIELGLEKIDTLGDNLSGQRIGVVMNTASVDHDLRLACDSIAKRWPGQVTCVFSPQHGIWGEQQANMIESEHSSYAPLNIPVYSLYSETRCPTPEMLDEIDCLVIDLQDVGTRVYTFIWTLYECLKACACHQKKVVVLDRPNPLGGEVCEGPILLPEYRSFVGLAEIPLRHGLTICELAQLFVQELNLDLELHCVPMTGWRRCYYFDDLNRNWIWPSPNMQTPTTSYVYPGQVLLEGTNLSEGRGTTRPFEVVGAPYLDPDQWCQELSRYEFPGLVLRPCRFQPTFDKWAGQSCGGIDIQVRDVTQVRSVELTVAIIVSAARLAGEQFAWLPPPYEYEFEKQPIDILFGNPRLRQVADTARLQEDASDMASLLEWDEPSWRHRIDQVLLYN